MILVTGAKGFIGQKLVMALEEIQKGSVFGIDIQDGMNLLSCPLPPEEDIDFIYHLAAQTSVESSWQDPLHDLDNVRMTARLVKEYPNTKIIHASSCAVINPKSPYGFSKKCAAEYLIYFHENHVNLVFPNIYGYGSKSVVDIFKESKEITIYGDGLQTRDFVHVDDIIKAMVLARNWIQGGYMLGSEKSTSVLALAQATKKNIYHAPARKEEREMIVPNISMDNWKPIVNVFEYLKG